ncbi:hypothetical protein [Paenibacillus sp. PAMC21692]|uniref:hypothetical protein n=1 Tax=Paenibacillus sp. PAMC21692 TaxID=2762320 RepID=UPI00164D95C0|nr:hypothetical protein [Paenibacillus sp. PAMC21692]QNK58010.1 hypothetical protein H7F31_03355 [Paenibacillus sp. PAMC21692]
MWKRYAQVVTGAVDTVEDHVTFASPGLRLAWMLVQLKESILDQLLPPKHQTLVTIDVRIRAVEFQVVRL